MAIIHGRRIINAIPGGGVAVDYSYEPLVFTTPLLYIEYDVLRPNKYTDVSADVTISIQDIPVSDGGILQLNKITGSEKITVNGLLNTIIPVISGVFTLNYLNNSGIVTFS